MCVCQILSAWSEELLEEWRQYATGFTIDPDTADLYRQKYAKSVTHPPLPYTHACDCTAVIDGADGSCVCRWRETISMQEEAKAARGAARRQALLERPKEGAVK